jgi:NAD(P)H-dependent flavin oxidoreductase YrpB (nitropropane dioxygenase family)
VTCNDRGEPIYGERDVPELERFRELGLPFWMAGSFAEAGKLAEARGLGAAGIQVGTAFAFCEESGLDAGLKNRVMAQVLSGNIDVLTDAVASPTGFPFKVLQLGGTLSESATYEGRHRGCDLGYLRSAHRKADGSIRYRCPAEPVQDYLHKGGQEPETCGPKCLCNGLLAAIGLGQVQAGGYAEPAIVTAGESVRQIARFLTPPRRSYTAAEVVQHLLGNSPTERAGNRTVHVPLAP